MPTWNEVEAQVSHLGDGDWEVVRLSEALAKVASGKLYECDICEQAGEYDDGCRSFHYAEQGKEEKPYLQQ